MAAFDDQMELLFLDTFSHPDNSEDLNLDLVQFPCAVVVHEVRIVPLGTRVVADVPGGVRLGATNPSSFKLELFVNNLGKPNASTFEKLGLLEYEANVDIQMKPEIKVATDGLIIKGWYQTITLAVYGTLTTVKQDTSPPPPPPIHTRSKPQSILPPGLEKHEFDVSAPVPAAAQKSTLERTSESAEKAAILTHPVVVQPSPKNQTTDHMHSPMGSPPINPRDIPLEHCGGTRDPRDQPRDVREKVPGKDARDRDLGGSEALDSYEEKREGKRDSSDGNEPGGGERFRSRSKSALQEDDKERDNDGRGDRADKARDKDLWGEKRLEDAEKAKEADREAVEKTSPRELGSKRGDSFTKSFSPHRSPSPGAQRKQSPSLRTTRIKSPDSTAHLPDETEPGEISETNIDLYGSPEGMELYHVLSDGEIQGDDDYSQISSDENNIQFEEEPVMGDLGDWDAVEDAWNYASIASFNPYQCDLAPLETFSDPSLTPYELEKQKLFLVKDDNVAMTPAAASQLLKMVQNFQSAPHDHTWIEAMEQVPSLIIPGLVHLVNKTDNKDVLEMLIDWTLEGLDVNRAVAQPETAYKVRHLKMGIRVAGALCSCDSYIAFRMLSREVQHRLLDLYTSPNMSTSIKVQIINALDQTTRQKEGLDWLLGRHHLQVGVNNHIQRTKPDTETVAAKTDSVSMDSDQDCKLEQMEVDNEKVDGNSAKVEEIFEQSTPASGYKRLLQIMLKKQTVRPMVGLTNLIRKAHAYEVLLQLMTLVDILQERYDQWLVENMPPTDRAKPQAASPEDGTEIVMEIDVAESHVVLDAVLEEEIETISRCLEEIARIFSNVDNLIGQPRCAMPNPARFELTKKPQGSLSNLFHMFSACRLLECIFVLLSSLATCNHSVLFMAIKNLLMQLMTQQDGLLYMSFRVDTINGILRTLTQNADYSPDEERELNPQNHLGLIMIYYLQTIQHIDQLREYQAKDVTEKELDDAAVLAVLHNLYSMTFSPQGRDAMVYVFTLSENVGVLLPFIEMTGDELRDSQIHRSVCYAYSVLILAFIVRYSENVQWLEIYGPKLLYFVEHECKAGKADEKVSELQEWLQPLKQIAAFNFDSSTVQELVLQLKQYTDDMSEIPKGLVTVVRVLKYMAIGPEYKDTDHVEELKYKYILVELYGANSLPLFVTILQKVRDLLLLPWQQGFPQSMSERTFILALVQPILSLMKATLSYLIFACGNSFKDVACLSSLLSIHTLMCSVSHTGVLAPEIQQIQNDIIDTLMAFTQPALAAEESEEALSQSLWSMMIKEVLKFTLTAPYTFLSGLIVISEMLPLPLPVQTRESLLPQELVEIVNNRKRWSAHLHPHSSEIQNIIKNLSGTSCQPLHQLLRRVCWQLADLAAPSALMIVRSLLDTLLESMDSSRTSLPEALLLQQQQPAGELGSSTLPSQSEAFSSSQTARVLNLLAFLMSQPPVKAAFLFLSRSGVKNDEKYEDVLSRLVFLLSIVSEAPSHVQAQESVVSIFQSLCDVEITLLTADCGNSPVQQLANGLPMKEQLSLICTGLLEHINNRDQKFSSILPSLRTLTLLMDHDYGFYYVKQAMEKLPSAFFNLFMQINATFSKDSSDCIATLSSAAECIQFLVSLPVPTESTADIPLAGLERTYTMSFAEVREMLGWSLSDDVVAHPLNDLDVLLCEYAKDEETLKAVYESVNAVVGILRSDEESVARPEISEPVLVTPETLTAQFNLRAIYLVTDDEDDRLSATYWLSTPMGDESDHEQDLVRCDLIAMSSYCPGFDLEAELKKGSTASDSSLVTKRKRRIGVTRRSTDTINTSKMRGSGTGFVAPMRGRGFGRGVNNNRSDLFRSRPPNTSRPPSMHVDDFDKFMAQNQQGPPVMQVGINQVRRPDMNAAYVSSTNDASRGHGFDGGRGSFANRGRFFTSPASYGHRDDGIGRGGYRGVVMQRGSLPSPRGGGGLIRGTATGPLIISHGSPSKVTPWVGRNTRQMYTVSGFGRGEVQHEQIERLDRRRDPISAGSYFIHGNVGGGGAGNSGGGGGGGGVPWMEHKDREPEQRYMGPPPVTVFPWRDRGRHQRTTR